MKFFPTRTGRVRLVVYRRDTNYSGYSLVLEEEKDFLWSTYFIDEPGTKNTHTYGYKSLAEFYQNYDIKFTPSMIKLTDEKLREWVLGLDTEREEFAIIRIGKRVKGTVVL